MMDYYAFLERKIRDANEIRQDAEVVYQAARLALRRQLHAQQPPSNFAETERHMSELKTRYAPGGGRGKPAGLGERKPDEAAVDEEANRASGAAPAQSVNARPSLGSGCPALGAAQIHTDGRGRLPLSPFRFRTSGFP